MQSKRRNIILALILIYLYACQKGPVLPTTTPSAIPNPTNIPRWVMYEKALLKATVHNEDGLCEWEILGTSNNQVFVWVKCKVKGPIGTAMSVPAIIYLGDNGVIEKVTIPRDGMDWGKDVRALFPSDIQNRIFARDLQGYADMEHLEERLRNGGPPLIVVSGTPQP